MRLFLFLYTIILSFTSCSSFGKKTDSQNKQNGENTNKIIFFAPEIYPEIREIQHPTNQSYFSAVTNRMEDFGNIKPILINNALKYDSIDLERIQEICTNNKAEAVVVSKISYFKVGIGKYVFSNQVDVQLKLYDKNGGFLKETHHNTYKNNARLLGSAENSIKIGTEGALKKIKKELKKQKSLL